jgi:hypothetical protein
MFRSATPIINFYKFDSGPFREMEIVGIWIDGYNLELIIMRGCI